MQENTATQQGVETNENNEIVGSTNPRNNVIAEIAARAAQQRDEDIKSALDNIYQEDAQIEEVAQEEQEQESQEDLIEIKVDGEIRQVPRSLVEEAGIKTLQKETAADRRLEEATRLLKEAQATQQRPSQDAAQKQPLPVEDEAVQLARAIQYGTEEEAAEVIKRLQGRNQATPEQIAGFVEDQITLREAFTAFKTEFPEVQKDPYLSALAIQMESAARRAGDKRPYAELYSAIGTELRKWRGNVVTKEDKIERKASVQAVPTASGRRPAPEQPKPKTASDIVDDMRRARHQI